MKELNNHIKTKKFARTYLFFGIEGFLVNRWKSALISAVLHEDDREMNMEVFRGRSEVSQIIDAAETIPFLAEHRLIVIEDSGLFSAGRSDDAAVMTDYIKSGVAESSVLIFIEQDVDKRNKLYKAIAKDGLAAEASSPKEGDAADWVLKLSTQNGLKMDKPLALYMIRTVTSDMQMMHNEIEKLAAYKGCQGEVSREDIDTICTKSLDAKIFDLMRAIGEKDVNKAQTLYRNLLTMKESPLMVLTMIARQFRYYLQCSCLSDRMNHNEIASKLALPPFAVRGFVEQSRNFSESAMMSALESCLETDYGIKSGQIGDALGVEVLIVKICTGYS